MLTLLGSAFPTIRAPVPASSQPPASEVGANLENERSELSQRRPGERPPALRPNNGRATRLHIWGATPCIEDRRARGLGQPLRRDGAIYDRPDGTASENRRPKGAANQAVKETPVQRESRPGQPGMAVHLETNSGHPVDHPANWRLALPYLWRPRPERPKSSRREPPSLVSSQSKRECW